MSFFLQHWNKLPRGEYSGGLYIHTVKIWRLCMFLIMLQSSKSGVASSWCRQIWDVCVIHFLYAEGQLADLESNFSVFFPLKSTSEVSQRLRIHFSLIHTQRGRAIPFWIFSDQFDRIPITDWPVCKKRITRYISNL